jgi:hypothetical protein
MLEGRLRAGLFFSQTWSIESERYLSDALAAP